MSVSGVALGPDSARRRRASSVDSPHGRLSAGIVSIFSTGSTRMWTAGTSPAYDSGKVPQQDQNVRWALPRLRRHPVRRLEVLSRIGDELRIAWMIDGLHADNRAHQLRTVLANVLDQFGLFVGRPGDEDGTCVCNRFSHGLQIGMILRRVSAADRICLMVDVPGRMIGMKNEPLHVSRCEMKDPGFTMVDPDDGVIVMRVHVQTPLRDSVPQPVSSCIAPSLTNRNRRRWNEECWPFPVALTFFPAGGGRAGRRQLRKTP